MGEIINLPEQILGILEMETNDPNVSFQFAALAYPLILGQLDDFVLVLQQIKFLQTNLGVNVKFHIPDSFWFFALFLKGREGKGRNIY